MITDIDPSLSRATPEEQQEGPVARAIEKQTSKIPSDVFLWAGIASMATSLGFLIAGKKQTSVFVGMWVPTILLFGLYNKVVKVAGHDKYQPDLH